MKALLLFSACLIVFTSRTQVNIITEAPSVSASAVTVSKNVFQSESALRLTKPDNLIPTLILNVPSNLFRYGITDQIEVRILNGLTYSKVANQESFDFDQIKMGAKYQFMQDNNRRTQVALMSHITIPYSTNKFLETESTVAVSHQLWRNHSLGYNVGYYYAHQTTNGFGGSQLNYFHQVNASLIYAYSLNSKFSVFGEIYSSALRSNYYPSAGFNVSFDFGMLYLFRHNIQLDYSFGRGIDVGFNYHNIGFNIFVPNARRRPGGHYPHF